MITRDQLIAAAALALLDVTRDASKVTPPDMAGAVIAAVEPLIRASERAEAYLAQTEADEHAIRDALAADARLMAIVTRLREMRDNYAAVAADEANYSRGYVLGMRRMRDDLDVLLGMPGCATTP